MMEQGQDRLDQLPHPNVPGVLLVIFVLAVANLAVTAAFQPAPLATNLVLMGGVSAIIALMLFMVVETANPFTGGAAILPLGCAT
jgi:hypothetical protein